MPTSKTLESVDKKLIRINPIESSNLIEICILCMWSRVAKINETLSESISDFLSTEVIDQNCTFDFARR